MQKAFLALHIILLLLLFFLVCFQGTPRNAELIKLFVKAYPAMTLQLLVVKLTEIEAVRHCYYLT